MNKIFNINLGGYPFTIDDNAYYEIDKYLKTIKNHFSKSEGCEDIIADIEIRIAELFNEHLKGQPIVSMREVQKVISIMGTPADFGAEDMTNEHFESKGSTAHKGKEGSTVGKRLFRDPDEKVIGGVCAGLSAYLGIEEPVWMRLGFVLLLITGLSPLFYIILWVVIPEARTSGDKLSMKGERINVSNIAKIG